MINRFFGRYRFLSNFYPVVIVHEEIMYYSLEAAYQASKTLDLDLRNEISKIKRPGEAKRKGTDIILREDWEEVKLDIMKELLTKKFEHPILRKDLIATDMELLVEGNTWGDIYWGVCNDVGENHLGLLLMEVREEIK